MKKFFQKILCNLPFGFNKFSHDKCKSVGSLTDQVDIIICLSCKRVFAINHHMKIVLPWEDIKPDYEIFKTHFVNFDKIQNKINEYKS